MLLLAFSLLLALLLLFYFDSAACISVIVFRLLGNVHVLLGRVLASRFQACGALCYLIGRVRLNCLLIWHFFFFPSLFLPPTH